MNTLSFEFESSPHARATLRVDGQDLLNLPALRRGGYLRPHVRAVTDLFSALRALEHHADTIRLEGVMLGESFNPGDGELLCDITINDGEMIWDAFRETHPAAFPDVGPFRFNLTGTLQNVKAASDALTSPPKTGGR